MNFLVGCSFSGTRLGCPDSIFNYIVLLFGSSVSGLVYEAFPTPVNIQPFAIKYPFVIITNLPPLLVETGSFLSLDIPSTVILNFLCNALFSDEYANFPLFALFRNFANS